MPAAAYADAQKRLEQFLSRDTARIGTSGRTLVFDHGSRRERATVLFHGMSATPRQLIGIATELHARGHNVFVPRLPRHGYQDRLSKALATLDSAQLKACVRDSIAIARGLGESVSVGGFSLGGLLTCYAGQTEAVHHAVALSPFLGVMLLPNALRSVAVRIALALPNRFYWWDPILRERQQPEHGYPHYATHAVAHGLTLAGELFERARSEAPAADRLTLVVHRFEPAVNNRAVHRLERAWRRTKPQAVELIRLHGLPAIHDIIEPERHRAIAARVNARMVELLAQ